MNLSFYTAAVGAMTQQEKLNIVANNIANANNDGYKTLTGTFASLLYQNVREPGTVISEARQGVGSKVQRTNISFGAGSLNPTNYPLDFTIVGEGFFAVRNPDTNETYYTRSGSFQMSQQQNGQFYLATPSGEHVLGPDMNPIVLQSEQDTDVAGKIGVFRFAHYEGFTAIGDNYYMPAERNGAPILATDAQIRSGVLEMSNVEIAKEFTNMIEAQRLYQMTLRMVTTSDEVEATINGLRR